MRNATWIGLAVGWICLTGLAHGQEGGTPDILHTGPGHITWANVDTSMYYTVEWRNALTTGELWQSVYEQFRDVQSQADTITRQIPTFFRVRAYPVPEFIRYLTATSHWMTAGFYAEDVDLTAVDPNLAAGNIRGGVSIFGVAGAVIEADGDAEPAQVLEGGTFSTAGAAGLTGTMPNRGAQNVTPGTAAQAILQGYHDGTGEVAGDADLAVGNIKAGVSIFGVDGAVVESTGDAGGGQVLAGATFSKAGEAGLTGTMPDIGQQNVTPGTAAQTITQGYHDGTGEVAGDAALVTSNIRGGVTLFGVAGKPEVVDTEDATAVAADLMEGKVAFVAGSAVTGTIATVTLSETTTVVQAGYIAATNLALVDADLAAGNIRADVTLFGVPGTVLQATGGALAAHVLTGQTFSRADAVDVSGTMPNIGQQTITPGIAAQTITQGYHDGTGSVAGDADLATGNIKAGVSIFGVGGTVVESTGDAGVGQVLVGATFSKAGEAGLTGTMPNIGQQTITPGIAAQTITQGYHDGTGEVAGDAALVTGNIRSGATIFGVAGDPNVVDTAAGDAVAADLLADRVAYVGGSVVTGTIATLTLSPDSAEVAEGFYAATNLTLVATNLVAENIREGVSLFGVTGTHEGAGSLSGMALIPAGDFVKTDHPDEIYDGYWVTNYISAFYLSRTHITKAQWDAVSSWASTNGYTDLPVGGGKGVDHPVQTVSWYAVVKWCNARSEMEGRPPAYYTDGTHATVYRTGSLDLTNACVAWTTGGYRLPTESEWEKAARGGLEAHRFPWAHGSRTNMISHHHANFWNSGSESYRYGPTDYHHEFNIGGMPYTSPVGSFAPNGYGLYDMSGNVWDWCWDRHVAAGSYYVAGSDLRGPDTGSPRVLRGGSWHAYAIYCRSAVRFDYDPINADYVIGFRVALPPGQ